MFQSFHTPSRQRSRSPRRAFTLVELLVVIGIIGVLITILLPALGRTRKMAQRLSCLSNLRSIGQGAAMYAAENGGYFPVAQYPGSGLPYSGTVCYSFDLKASFKNPTFPLGLGLVISGNYISAINAPQLFHDVEMDTTTSGYMGHCMDVPPGTNPWGAGASWFATTNNTRIIYAYNYRATSYYYAAISNQSSHPFMQQGSVGPLTVMITDQLDPRFGRRFTHIEGYNFLRADGSGQWWSDPGREVEKISAGNTVDGIASVSTDELIYQMLEQAN